MKPERNDDEASAPILNASTVLLIPATDLSAARGRLGPIVEAGIAAVVVRDPENRSRVTVRLLPGVPSTSAAEIERAIDVMERSTLVTTETARKLKAVVTLLTKMVPPKRDQWSTAGGLSGNLDIDGTLSSQMSAGDIFCLLNLTAEDDRLAIALGGLPRASRLGQVGCSVAVNGRGRSYWDDWSLGVVEKGSCEAAKVRLDEIVDKRRMSSESARQMALWLDEMAARTASYGPIRRHR